MPAMALIPAATAVSGMTAVASVHPVAKEVHGDKKNEKCEEKPVFPDPVHGMPPSIYLIHKLMHIPDRRATRIYY